MSESVEPPSSPSTGPAPSVFSRSAVNLFLIGFLVLFLELACIRWFAAYVIFLQFFTNVVLIACFLGISCGCMTAGSRRDWLVAFPLLGLATFLAALGSLFIFLQWSGVAVDVGNQASQMAFFGTENGRMDSGPTAPDVAQFIVPIELLAGGFFTLIALLFVGLGQALGRAIEAYPNRVMGYTLNIGGSLAGIAAFAAVSLVQMPPVGWFAIGLAGVAWLLYQSGRLNWTGGVLLVLLLGATAVPPSHSPGDETEVRWSPYYAVVRAGPAIYANTMNHQSMIPFDSAGTSSYFSLIHLLQERSGGKPFENVLVIGAGSGNDVAAALRFGAKRVDAVEIDPVIQDIGAREHPDLPYQDPRVFAHVEDGRHFLRTTDQKYDLVVYGSVDSLILHSSYASIRLESFLYTEQAFEDVRRVLKPDGVFLTCNFFRWGWIVHRIAAMSEHTFGRKPLVVSIPSRETLGPDDSAKGWVLVISGNTAPMQEAFAQSGYFRLFPLASQNQESDGFSPMAKPGPGAPIFPTALVSGGEAASAPSDDWPFLYTRGRKLPMLSIRFMLLLGAISVAMIYWLTPKGRAPGGWRMFFLGAAFLLLETKAVVNLALLFGSTWFVNTIVFFTVLTLILLANLYTLKVRTIRLRWHYACLFVLLAANVLIPLDIFLGGGILWRCVAPCALTLGPMFFAGVIFARSFRDSPNPGRALGANISGSVVGGLSESFSMVVGFRCLMLLAIAFYALSAIRPRKA